MNVYQVEVHSTLDDKINMKVLYTNIHAPHVNEAKKTAEHYFMIEIQAMENTGKWGKCMSDGITSRAIQIIDRELVWEDTYG